MVRGREVLRTRRIICKGRLWMDSESIRRSMLPSDNNKVISKGWRKYEYRSADGYIGRMSVYIVWLLACLLACLFM
jgi:hypothetical protein